MTDNRTTELREKLTERGIEYTTNDHMGVCETSWNGFTVMQLTPSAKLIMTVTPEQAIAATLGRPKAKSHPYGYERDTGAYDCTRCECGCINDISAKYCNDCGGEIEIDESAEKEYYDGCSKHMVFAKKHDDGSLELCERRYVPEESATRGALTAEQVMKIAGKHQPDYCSDTHVCFDWQAIADELNVALGSGTCELEPLSALDVTLNMLDQTAWGVCSECGTASPMDATFCCECGRKVKR